MRLDQIVFRWSPRTLTGGRGVGPVAGSPEPALLRWWSERLEPEIWAAEEPPGGPPGLSYLRFGDDAAVLRKTPVADENGRPGATFTHALFGPASGLTPGLALEAFDWHGWCDPDDPLPEDGALKPVEIVAPERPATLVPPDARAETAALIGHILAEPGARFTVVEPSASAVGLVRAVLDIVGPAVAGPWTFATRETSDTGRDGVRLVVLVREPGFSSHSVPRRRVRLDGPAPPFAATLVEAYERGGPEALARIAPAEPITDAERAKHWEDAVHLAPGVLRDPGGLLVRAARGDLSSAEQAFLDTEKGRDYLATSLGGLSDDSLAAAAGRWPDRHTGIGVMVANELLGRCVRGDWPSAVLLRAARRDSFRDGVGAALEARLRDLSGVPGYDRARVAATAIAAALAIAPALPPPSRPRGSAGRALRATLTERVYFLQELRIVFGDDDADLVTVLRALLRLAHGPEFVRGEGEAAEILARCAYHPAAVSAVGPQGRHGPAHAAPARRSMPPLRVAVPVVAAVAVGVAVLSYVVIGLLGG